MRILQILPEMNVGGVETGTLDFAEYLAEHKHHSVVVSNGGTLVDELESSGTTHYTLPVHKKSLWSMLRCVGPLRKIIRKERIDIVHARSRVPAWIAYWASRKTQAQFITTCHGYYHNKLFSQVMGWSKFVIVPSAAIGRYMIEDYHVPAENIRCVPRSVNLQRHRLRRGKVTNPSEKIIAIVGRVTALKGHPHFFKAMGKVLRQIPYAKVWVIGDVPKKKESYKEELRLLVKRLGISEQVEFLGTRSDVADLLKKVDVLAFASTVPESFGRVILEAQAAGVPVVATNVGGVVDIIDDNETGILVLPKDSDAMGDAVLRLLRDPKLGRKFTKAAQTKIKERFTVDHMAGNTLKVYKELRQKQKILIIKLSAMGDVVLITAALKAIRKKYKHAEIHCLVGKESRKILQNCPYLDGVLLYDKKGPESGWLGVLRLGSKLRKMGFDKVIDFQNNRRSHMLSYLSFPKESFGYHNKKWGGLLTHSIKNLKRNIPPVEHQFEVLKLLEIKYDAEPLDLWPSEKDQAYAVELLDEEWLGNVKNVVGINLAASEKWETKNWPVEHMARLCDRLSEDNVRVLLTGMEKDRERVSKILELTESKPAVLIGKTDILQLSEIIRRCRVYITPDSAPMHIAAAVKTPLICFFGPTDPARHLPPTDDCVVLRKTLDCSPCYSSQCRIKTHACMTEITPEEVYQQIDVLMGERV